MSLDVQAPMPLPISNNGPGQIQKANQKKSHQRLRQNLSKADRGVSTGHPNERRDGRSPRNSIQRNLAEKKLEDGSVSKFRSTGSSGSREAGVADALADSIGAHSEMGRQGSLDANNQRKPMLQRARASPNMQQRRPQPTGGARPGGRGLGRGRPGQYGAGGIQSRGGTSQKRMERRPKRASTTISKRPNLPSNPALNDYTGESPVRKYDEKGLLVYPGQHAQLSQPITPKVTSFVSPTPLQSGASDAELKRVSTLVPALVVSSYAGRAIPKAASKQVGAGLDIMDNAKLALCRVRDLRNTQRTKAIRLVQTYVDREITSSAKVKL